MGTKRKVVEPISSFIKISDLLNRLNICDYLPFLEYVKFRRVCKSTLNMHRIATCYDVAVGSACLVD